MSEMGESCLYLCIIRPIMSLIMFLVTVVPNIILITVPNFLLCIFYVPMDAYLVIKTLYKTKRIGPNLKVFGTILFPICAVLYPIIALLAFIFYSICISAYYSFALDICGILENIGTTVREVNRSLGIEAYEYSLKMTEPVLGTEVAVYDVSFHLLILCSFVSIITVIINFILLLILNVCWFIPLYLRCAYYGLIFLFSSDVSVGILLIVPTIIYELAVPVLCVLLCVFYPLIFASQGIYCGIDTYNHGLSKAIENNWSSICSSSSKIIEFIFGKQ